MACTRMDQATQADFDAIRKAGGAYQNRLPTRIRAMLLQLQYFWDGHDISQFQHCLQTATRAVRDNASEELVLAALCHDIGHAISIANHATIAAEIMSAYVSQPTYEIVRTHDIFQGKWSFASIGRDPEERLMFAQEPWYAEACRFAEWDMLSFDPQYNCLPMEYFAGIIDRFFSAPRPDFCAPQRQNMGSAQQVDRSEVVLSFSRD